MSVETGRADSSAARAVPNLRLPQAALEQIRADGERAYPGECCGLLVGTMDPATYDVVRAEPCTNLREGEADDRFELDPKDYLDVDRRARNDGLEIIGVYHSHPDHAPRPSRFDAEAAFPGFAYVIVAVRSGKAAGMRSWLLDDSGAFREQVIV